MPVHVCAQRPEWVPRVEHLTHAGEDALIVTTALFAVRSPLLPQPRLVAAHCPSLHFKSHPSPHTHTHTDVDYLITWQIAFVAIAVLSRRVDRRLRLFHYLTLTIVGTALISYLAMSFGIGVAWVPSFMHGHAHHDHGPAHGQVVRQVFYARYIDWLVRLPPVLLHRFCPDATRDTLSRD